VKPVVIDKQGRLFGKLSIIDIAVLVVIIGLLIGLGYRRLSSKAAVIVNADTKFYVTLVVERIRDFSLEAIDEGDIIYEQYAQQPFGKIVATETEQSKEVLKKPDGTISYVPMEQKFNLYATLECTGNVGDNGYYVNGNSQIAIGSDLRIQSNKVICTARVVGLSLSR
jgi:hypothetical protein